MKSSRFIDQSSKKKSTFYLLVATFGTAAAVTSITPASAQAMQSQTKPLQTTSPMEQGSTTAPSKQGKAAQDFSQKTIDAAGRAMTDMQKINSKYMPQMQAAEQARNQKRIQKLIRKFRDDTRKKLASDGITPRKYQEVMVDARSNPVLREKVLNAASAARKN